jgi:hypothetical protein
MREGFTFKKAACRFKVDRALSVNSALSKPKPTVSPTCASFSDGLISADAVDADEEVDEDEAESDALVEALSPVTSEAVSQAANKSVAATITSRR